MKHAKVEPRRRPPTVAVVAAGLVVMAGAVAVVVGLTSGTAPEAATSQEAPATGEAPVLRRVLRAFPDEAEVQENPRARSAVLRVAERCA